jgi:hypothetical protein
MSSFNEIFYFVNLQSKSLNFVNCVEIMRNLKTIINGAENFTAEEACNLAEYMASIEFLAQNGLNLEFTNKDQFHGAIVMSTIFASAQESIRIFAGTFSGEISNSPIYLQKIHKAISSEKKTTDVIFECQPNQQSQCLNLLKRLKNEGKDVSLRVLDGGYRSRMTKEQLHHFTIGDSNMFRYEIDSQKFTAICNFDDKKTVSRLLTNFLIFKLNSQELT